MSCTYRGLVARSKATQVSLPKLAGPLGEASTFVLGDEFVSYGCGSKPMAVLILGYLF